MRVLVLSPSNEDEWAYCYIIQVWFVLCIVQLNRDMTDDLQDWSGLALAGCWETAENYIYRESRHRPITVGPVVKPFQHVLSIGAEVKAIVRTKFSS